MAQKGAKVTVDIPALEQIIVAANRFSNVLQTESATIRATCNEMETEESLIGGEGDTIRESFRQIGEGMSNMENSMQSAVGTLENSLNHAIKMQKGRMAGDTQEKTAAAAKKAGIFKKS